MNADPASSGATGVVLFFLCVIVYFLPAATAWNKRNFGSVFALNFFLGWTIVGWVVALCWGLMDNAPTQQVVIQQPPAPLPPAVFCSGCGKYSPAGARFCSVCGQSFIILPPAFQCVSCGKPALTGSKLCGACGGFGRSLD